MPYRPASTSLGIALQISGNIPSESNHLLSNDASKPPMNNSEVILSRRALLKQTYASFWLSLLMLLYAGPALAVKAWIVWRGDPNKTLTQGLIFVQPEMDFPVDCEIRWRETERSSGMTGIRGRLFLLDVAGWKTHNTLGPLTTGQPTDYEPLVTCTMSDGEKERRQDVILRENAARARQMREQQQREEAARKEREKQEVARQQQIREEQARTQAQRERETLKQEERAALQEAYRKEAEETRRQWEQRKLESDNNMRIAAEAEKRRQEEQDRLDRERKYKQQQAKEKTERENLQRQQKIQAINNVANSAASLIQSTAENDKQIRSIIENSNLEINRLRQSIASSEEKAANDFEIVRLALSNKPDTEKNEKYRELENSLNDETSRFTIEKNTFTDKKTGKTWVRSAKKGRYSDAIDHCQDRKDGEWRLPTWEELDEIFSPYKEKCQKLLYSDISIIQSGGAMGVSIYCQNPPWIISRITLVNSYWTNEIAEKNLFSGNIITIYTPLMQKSSSSSKIDENIDIKYNSLCIKK